VCDVTCIPDVKPRETAATPHPPFSVNGRCRVSLRTAAHGDFSYVKTGILATVKLANSTVQDGPFASTAHILDASWALIEMVRLGKCLSSRYSAVPMLLMSLPTCVAFVASSAARPGSTSFHTPCTRPSVQTVMASSRSAAVGFVKDRAAGAAVAGSIGFIAEATARRLPISLSPLKPAEKGRAFAKKRLLHAGYGATSSVAKILTIGSIIMMMVMVPPLLFLIDSGVACLHFAAHKHAAVTY
jgi:hypothetical protein